MKRPYEASTPHGAVAEVDLPKTLNISRDFLRRVDILDAAVAGLRQDRERLAREIAALRKLLEAASAQHAGDIARLVERIAELVSGKLQ